MIEAIEARPEPVGWVRAARPAAWAAPIVLALAGLVVALPTLRVMLEDEPNDNAIQLLTGIDDKLGDTDVPVLWGATEGPETPDFGFPSSWHAYGLPLQFTFGQKVLNIPRLEGPFSPDPILTDDDLLMATACQADGRVRVVEWDRGGEPIDRRSSDLDLGFRRLGSEEVATPRLSQPHRSRWLIPVSRIAVYEVQGPPDPDADCATLIQRLQ